MHGPGRTISPTLHTRTIGRAAAYAAHSFAAAARSLSPTLQHGYAAMFDAPSSSSPMQLVPGEDVRGARATPTVRPAEAAPARAPRHHTVIGMGIVAPQARRGAVYLNRRHQRRRRRSPPHEEVWHAFKACAHALAHPCACAAALCGRAREQLAHCDALFRDPATHQRTWWPAWLAAYVPLLIWVGVSVLSTSVMVLFRAHVFRGLDALSVALRELGVLGRVAFGALIFATTFPPMPLYSTLVVLSGFAFGRWQGFVVSYVAALSGACAVFLLSRSLLHGWMMRMLRHAGGLHKVVRAIERQPRLLFLVRLAPYPYNLLNTLLASSSVLTLRTYLGCTALALPKLLVHTSIGASIQSFAAYQDEARERRGGALHQGATYVGAALCVGLFVYLSWMANRAVDELDEDAELESLEDDLSDEDDKASLIGSPRTPSTASLRRVSSPKRRTTPLDRRARPPLPTPQHSHHALVDPIAELEAAAEGHENTIL